MPGFGRTRFRQDDSHHQPGPLSYGEKAGVDPSHILVITFTRAAAREMKERYEQIDAQAGCKAGFPSGPSILSFF